MLTLDWKFLSDVATLLTAFAMVGGFVGLLAGVMALGIKFTKDR